MTNQDKQYYIYLRSADPDNRRVPCTKQQFDDYYRDINAYRRTQMNRGRCVCPRSKWLACDMDCFTCSYHTSGDLGSLDDNYTDEEGNETQWLDRLQEKSPDLQTLHLDDQVSDALYMREILKRLCEIMPQAIEIGRLRQAGNTDVAISEKIGVKNTTFISRLKKVQKILQEEFPEFF